MEVVGFNSHGINTFVELDSLVAGYPVEVDVVSVAFADPFARFSCSEDGDDLE